MHHLRSTALALLIVAFPQVLSGHHSRAEFDSDTVEIIGELVSVTWINPHPSFRLRPSNDPSAVVDVQVYGSIGTLNETGVAREMFNVGDQITLAGQFSARRPNLLLGTHALLPSGLEAVLQYNAEPRWSGERVGGLGSVVIDESILRRAASANRGIFRVWSPASTAEAIESLRAMNRSYTDVALSARENWDLTDNPITRCEQPWIPHAAFQPVRREFVDNGDSLLLINPYLGGLTRTIYLGEIPNNVDRTPSRVGLSIGRWEGRTLVVETSGLNAPAFDGLGTLQSPEMLVVERFTLSQDQARLDYEMTMDDPIAFNVPVVFRLQFYALEHELPTGRCGETVD